MDEDTRYEAVRSRDARFDGVFFFAVETTGIYCRPSCPAVPPKRRNVRFFRTAAAAQGSGFRACRRCRPDAVPGSAEWDTRADVVGRAMRLIGDGVVDREGVAGLAVRLGYSARQLQRQLTAELGAGPIALARAQRAHTARVLLRTTALPVTEVAYAAGFTSVRQFNDTIRAVYDTTPTGLRATGSYKDPYRERVPDGLVLDGLRERTRGAHKGHVLGDGKECAPGDGKGHAPGALSLRLAHRAPYAAAPLFDQLAREALPGVEEVTGAPGARVHRRTLRLPYGPGVAEVDEASPGPPPRPGAALHPGGWLDVRLRLADLRDLTTAVQRLRRLFDLDADPYAVDERLAADAELAPLVAARPGLRVPGAADAQEFALRAVAGPAGSERLVKAYGTPLDAPTGGLTHLFPTARTLADALADTEPDSPVRALAAALAEGRLCLDAGADRESAGAALLGLPGVAAGTVAEVRARALGDPDVVPPGLGARGGWRPWSSYAAQHLYVQRTLENRT